MRQDYDTGQPEDTGCGGGERLASGHGIQVVIGSNAKRQQRLIQHLAVLRGDGHPDAELLTPGLHVPNNGRKFNGFRAGAKNEKCIQHGSAESAMTEGDSTLSKVVG